jgi:hypothetical protein
MVLKFALKERVVRPCPGLNWLRRTDHNTVTYLGACDYRLGMGWILGLLTTYTPLRATRNYRAIAHLHFTVHRHTRARVLSLH